MVDSVRYIAWQNCEVVGAIASESCHGEEYLDTCASLQGVEWLTGTLRRELDAVNGHLNSSQLIYVDWPNYPEQNIWDVRVTPFPGLELRYVTHMHITHRYSPPLECKIGAACS
jgi:hypothetical protein